MRNIGGVDADGNGELRELGWGLGNEEYRGRGWRVKCGWGNVRRGVRGPVKCSVGGRGGLESS